jgi:hypothetical protein
VHALIAFLSGESDGAVAEAEETVGIAGELGSAFHSVLALEGLGAAHLAAGSGTDALRPLEEALALLRERHVGLFEEASLLSYLADAHIPVGDGEAALEAAGAALDVARRQNARVHECHALLAHARALRWGRGRDAVEAIAADLVAGHSLIEEVGALAWLPFLARERAWLAGEEP